MTRFEGRDMETPDKAGESRKERVREAAGEEEMEEEESDNAANTLFSFRMDKAHLIQATLSALVTICNRLMCTSAGRPRCGRRE